MNLHRNIGNGTHILRLAAAPTRYLFDLEHYFVLDNRASLCLRNGIPSDYLIPFLFPISPGTKFRTVVSLSNGRRVSIFRAKSAKWISIRPSTKSIPLAVPIPFFPAGFFPRFYLAPLHLTKSSPRASLVAAIKFAWKLFRVEQPNLNSLPDAFWNRYNPDRKCVCYFLIPVER